MRPFFSVLCSHCWACCLLAAPELCFPIIPKTVAAVITFTSWNTDMTLHSFNARAIHAEIWVQFLGHTCPFLSPLMPLFLIGVETCWEERICRQKCLRNYMGSVVSIWWTLCGSPEKNSDPSVFSGSVRRGCSLINITSVLDSIGGVMRRSGTFTKH